MTRSQLEEWFNVVMDEHLPMITIYARSRLPDDCKSEAEDFAMEAFLNFWNHLIKLGYIPQIKNMGAFLRVILLNVLRSHFRKKKTLFERGISIIASVWPDKQSSSESEYLSIWEQVEMRNGLLHYVDQLPEKQRECVILHYINELTFAEIAVFTNATMNSVRVNTYRGLKRLKGIYPPKGRWL